MQIAERAAMWRRERRVLQRVSRVAAALFGAWWNKTPPLRTRREELAAGNALQRAALNDWPCPAGLDEDELDRPGYQPQCGWRYARGTGVADDYPLAERKAAS
jgi:hypothetical protein